MNGINGMNSSIAQILGPNSQSASSSQSSDSASGVEAYGGFAPFNLQDSGATNSDTLSELTSQSEAVTGQLSNSIMSMLLELQETSTTTDGSTGFDAQQLFSDMDTDGDGTLTKDEFMAAAPDDVTEEMSENLWNVMAGSDAESISEDDYLASMTPPTGAMPATQSDEADSVMAGVATAVGEDGTYDPLDTNEDGVVSLSEIMAAAPQEASPSDRNSESKQDALSETVNTEQRADVPRDGQPMTDGIDPRNEAFGSKLMAQVIG
ncbi:MAG: EF-hand domain-containing protein [Rhodospirillales bacterium]|nr:EF-hand domain-containing protein [Rhodospirillales bacterium]